MRTGASEGMTTAEAAQKTGLSIHTLRYYEQEGLLLSPVDRNESGRRAYSDKDLEWIINCAKFRATGMPIADIRKYAQLVRSGNGNEAERLAILEAHRERVQARLKDILENLGRAQELVDGVKHAGGWRACRGRGKSGASVRSEILA